MTIAIASIAATTFFCTMLVRSINRASRERLAADKRWSDAMADIARQQAEREGKPYRGW